MLYYYRDNIVAIGLFFGRYFYVYCIQKWAKIEFSNFIKYLTAYNFVLVAFQQCKKFIQIIIQ